MTERNRRHQNGCWSTSTYLCYQYFLPKSITLNCPKLKKPLTTSYSNASCDLDMIIPSVITMTQIAKNKGYNF
jgi:hypothetical protein